MGRGYIKQKNQLKKQYLAPLRKYAEQLEEENKTLKNDPESVVGQFIGEYREVYAQNQRLSVLVATLIRKLSDKVTVTKDEMEAFQNKLINIKWEIADGASAETAKEYIFSYELKDAPPMGLPVQTTEDPECIDPNCTLPKDLQHTHTLDNPVVEDHEDVAGELPALGQECNDPDCQASENGPHYHQKKTVI